MTPVHKAPPLGGALPVPKAPTAQSLPPGLVGASPAARPPPARQSPSSSMQTDGATPQPKRSTVQSPAWANKIVPPADLIAFNLPGPKQEANLRVACRYACGASFLDVKAEISHVGHCMMNANCRHYIQNPSDLPQAVKDRIEAVKTAQRAQSQRGAK